MRNGRRRMNEIFSPNPFVAIVDKDGDVDDCVTMHDDMIQSVLRAKDRDDPDYAPHSALLWDGTVWRCWS